MLYHGLIVIGTSAILLLIYNLIIVRWCTNRHSSARHIVSSDASASESIIEAVKRSNRNRGVSVLLPSFKFRKESHQQEERTTSPDDCDDQCAVCLSVFEDGEDLKRLPRCKHSFHAQCIDMWLYSHLDCPICRTAAQPDPAPQQQQKPNERSSVILAGVVDPGHMV